MFLVARNTNKPDVYDDVYMTNIIYMTLLSEVDF